MKRYIVVLTLLIVLLLSGCKGKEYEFDSNIINNMTDVKGIFQVMMDEGNYDENTKIQFNNTAVFISFSNDLLVVDVVQFSVFKEFSREEYNYDLNVCGNNDGNLICSVESTSDNFIQKEEVLLTYAVENLTSIDPMEIFLELEREFILPAYERKSIHLRLKDINNIEEGIKRYENVVFYYDDEFHYDELYTPEEMMIELQVFFTTGFTGEMYVVYIEMD